MIGLKIAFMSVVTLISIAIAGLVPLAAYEIFQIVNPISELARVAMAGVLLVTAGSLSVVGVVLGIAVWVAGLKSVLETR